jgi:hypothetical protein
VQCLFFGSKWSNWLVYFRSKSPNDILSTFHRHHREVSVSLLVLPDVVILVESLRGMLYWSLWKVRTAHSQDSSALTRNSHEQNAILWYVWYLNCVSLKMVDIDIALTNNWMAKKMGSGVPNFDTISCEWYLASPNNPKSMYIVCTTRHGHRRKAWKQQAHVPMSQVAVQPTSSVHNFSAWIWKAPLG